MQTSLLYSTSHDPWFNLAVEDWIFTDMDPDGIILYLWQNADTVVIGRYQNPWTECRLDKMKEDGVKLARRQSGGGAVYHDLHNLNFTVMCGSENYDRENNFSMILEALADFGIKAEVSGRNDITVSGRKVSGSAFRMKRDRVFHHGTLLVNTDLSRLAEYLNPDILKLQSKGIKSVQSRVANLTDFNPEITVEDLASAVGRAFFRRFGDGQRIQLDPDSMKDNQRVADYCRLLGSDSWLYEKSPAFSNCIAARFDWGGIEIHLDIQKGRIESAGIITDALSVEMISALETGLPGMLYSFPGLTVLIDALQLQNPEWTDALNDIRTMLHKELL